MLECIRIFLLKLNRCPKCFTYLGHCSTLFEDYAYCHKCMDVAYYEDFSEREFRD